MTPYTILSSTVTHRLVEKNSTFLTFLKPVSDREQALHYLAQYRQQYKHANHVCWAYIIGNTRQPQTQAFSDDGEPSGTAGKPMLHVLTERELGNTLAVVVRYFGGVKLGAGGLVRAYSAAVSQATALAKLKTLSPQCELTVALSFADEARLRQLLQQFGGEVLSQQYAECVTLQLRLPAQAATAFCQHLSELTAGQAKVLTPTLENH